MATGFHFNVTRESNLPSARLGALVTTVLESHHAGDVLIIHVLTHGRKKPRFHGIFALGSDGTCDDSADVKKWLDVCAKYDNDGPQVLFLLDICHAGEAAEIDALMRTSEAQRTWILAATRADESAFEARFTRSLTDVLTRIDRAGLDLNPGDRYVPLDTFARQVRQAVYELAD
ncbi:hypothetical protein ACFQ1S_23180, partial [Kibdelosporangium lantanae]